MNRKLFWLLLTLISVIVVALRLFFNRPLVHFSHIECRLGTQPCPEELEQQVQTLKKTSFFFQRLEQEIAAWDLMLYQLESYQKVWPGQLRLQFVSEPGYYQLQLAERVITVTQSGFVTATDNVENLPIFLLTGEQFQAVAPHQDNQSAVPTQLHQNLSKIVAQLNQLSLSIPTLSYQPDLPKLQLASDLVALVEPQKLEPQLTRLALILEELDLDQIDVAIKEIDLRYELPVLRTQPKP